MSKSIALACCLFLCKPGTSQILSAPRFYLGSVYTHTVTDVTKENNPWGLGVSTQIFTKGIGWLQPTFELSNFAFLENKGEPVFVHPLPLDQQDADYYAIPRESYPNFQNMANLLAGVSLFPRRFLFVSFTGGISLTNRLRWAEKSFVGFCFPKNQRIMVTASYLTIFKRIPGTQADYTGWSLGLAVRMH